MLVHKPTMRLMTMSTNADLLDPVDTPRLRLRCVRLKDAAPLAELMTPAVRRWVASWPVPFTSDMAAERIARMRESARAGRELPFAVERRADGEVLGLVGVGQDRTDSRRGSLGYWVGEAYQGAGVMREAAPAAMAAAFDRLGLDVIEAGAHPENAASFAVMRACGMRPVGEREVFALARGRHERCLFYEVERPKR